MSKLALELINCQYGKHKWIHVNDILGGRRVMMCCVCGYPRYKNKKNND